MNQALSYIMLIVVGLTVVAPIIIYAQGNIANNVLSYHDFVVLENKRVSQQIIATHIQHDSDPTKAEIHIHIVNTGVEDIVFENVLADGVLLNHDDMSGNCWDPPNTKSTKGYCFYDSTSGANNKNEHTPVSVDGNIRIGITYDPSNYPPTFSPEKIQLVTDAFKLFEIAVPP